MEKTAIEDVENQPNPLDVHDTGLTDGGRFEFTCQDCGTSFSL